MDILDESLDSGQDIKGDTPPPDETTIQLTDTGEEVAITNVTGSAAILDPNVQYQFRAEATGLDGQVTYRVVHVAPSDADGQVVTAQGTQLTQAVIQSPFSNGGGSPSAESGGEARFTYFPTGGGDAGTVASQSSDVATVPIGQVTTAGGQFYVMMSPQDVLQNQRSIAPRTHSFSPKLDGTRTTRDDRKRATHNEVERRRRDKINSWIVQLSKLVPECSQDHIKAGQVGSKGGILAKACEYIQELKSSNVRMSESLKGTEGLAMDVELMRQQCEELKQENAVLRAQLQQNGLLSPDLVGNPT